MSATRSASGPDGADAGSWATETLPMSVRKELLERELNKLGFRRASAQAGSPSHDGGGSQQQGDAGSSHPQADGGSSDQHAD